MMEVGGQRERSAIISNRSLRCGSSAQKTSSPLGGKLTGGGVFGAWCVYARTYSVSAGPGFRSSC